MTTTNPTWTTESDYCPLTGDRPERVCPICCGDGHHIDRGSDGINWCFSTWSKCRHCSGFGTLRGNDV